MPATFGTYSRGAPRRPAITHDNGHLDRFARRDPGVTDYAAYLAWQAILNGAEAAQGFGPFEKTHMPDALAAYRHFMAGSGLPRRILYERYVRNDENGRLTLQNQIAEAMNAALTLYLASGRIQDEVFDFTGSALFGGSDRMPAFPYPATENWQKALGAYAFWISGTVGAVVTPGTGPGPARLDNVQFELTLTVHVEDMYNFNVDGAVDIATGIPDGANGRFEVTGLARQYLNYDEISRTVSWTGGATDAFSPSLGDRIDRLRRQRGPQDARRARDRV